MFFLQKSRFLGLYKLFCIAHCSAVGELARGGSLAVAVGVIDIIRQVTGDKKHMAMET